MRDFPRDSLANEKDPLGRMHLLMDALHKKLAFEPGETDAPRPAAEVFEAGDGSARELAQVFVAAARELNVPARFVSGFFLGARSAWREAGRPSCLGGDLRRPASAGSASTPRSASARATPICASPRGSIISPPRPGAPSASPPPARKSAPP